MIIGPSDRIVLIFRKVGPYLVLIFQKNGPYLVLNKYFFSLRTSFSITVCAISKKSRKNCLISGHLKTHSIPKPAISDGIELLSIS